MRGIKDERSLIKKKKKIKKRGRDPPYGSRTQKE